MGNFSFPVSVVKNLTDFPNYFNNKDVEPVAGQETDDTTASVLNGGTSLSVPDNFGVRVKALANNTDPVYVGGSGVSESDGFELAPKAGLLLYVSDVNLIHFIASSSGDGVSWIIEQVS